MHNSLSLQELDQILVEAFDSICSNRYSNARRANSSILALRSLPLPVVTTLLTSTPGPITANTTVPLKINSIPRVHCLTAYDSVDDLPSVPPFHSLQRTKYSPTSPLHSSPIPIQPPQSGHFISQTL